MIMVLIAAERVTAQLATSAELSLTITLLCNLCHGQSYTIANVGQDHIIGHAKPPPPPGKPAQMINVVCFGEVITIPGII